MKIALVSVNKKAVLIVQDGLEDSAVAFLLSPHLSLFRETIHRAAAGRHRLSLLDRLLLMSSPFGRRLYNTPFFDFFKSESQKKHEKW